MMFTAESLTGVLVPIIRLNFAAALSGFLAALSQARLPRCLLPLLIGEDVADGVTSFSGRGSAAGGPSRRSYEQMALFVCPEVDSDVVHACTSESALPLPFVCVVYPSGPVMIGSDHLPTNKQHIVRAEVADADGWGRHALRSNCLTLDVDELPARFHRGVT